MIDVSHMTNRLVSLPARVLGGQKSLNQENMKSFLVLLVYVIRFAWCVQDLSSYPFKATLNTAENGGLYELYWNFDNDAETISFAVRVQTTGWVGFGLSPNGQMPNSDVVIGWVTDDGETVFHVRRL